MKRKHEAPLFYVNSSGAIRVDNTSGNGIKAGYMRHQAAPCAFNYWGELRAAYWPYREACDKGGKQILSNG